MYHAHPCTSNDDHETAEVHPETHWGWVLWCVDGFLAIFWLNEKFFGLRFSLQLHRSTASLLLRKREGEREREIFYIIYIYIIWYTQIHTVCMYTRRWRDFAHAVRMVDIVGQPSFSSSFRPPPLVFVFAEGNYLNHSAKLAAGEKAGLWITMVQPRKP